MASPIVQGPLTVTGTTASIPWSTLLPMTSQVSYGVTSAYDYLTPLDTALVTNHSTVLSGLTCGTTYHFQITDAAVGGDETPASVSRSADATFTTSNCASGNSSNSDQFDGVVLNTALWSQVNPLNDAAFSSNGSELVISVPSGLSHDPWSGNGNAAPRLMQTISDNDFEVVAKFDSPVVYTSQNEGLIVEQDAANFLRFEVYYSGGVRLFAGSFFGNQPTVFLNSPISTTWPVWLKVNRTGNVWTFSWSQNGTNFNKAIAVSKSMTVTKIGPFAANCCASTSPAFSSRVDFFLISNTAVPAASPLSDNFDRTTLGSGWTFVSPRGDSAVSLTGAELQISVPGGVTHDPWDSPGNTSARVMQPISDVDFEVVAKFNSAVAVNSQNEGILVEQDGGNFVRFEVYYSGGGVRLFSGTFLSGQPAVKLNTQIVPSWPIWLKVSRSASSWKYSWSTDGSSYATATTFTQPLTANKIGVFAANCCSVSPPPFVSRVDYFFNTANPLVP